MFLVRFNRRFASLTATHFVEDVLHRQLGVKHVVTGYNFAFGKDRGGSTDFLEKQAHHFGFGFTACPPVKNSQGSVISSSAIRQCLLQGDVRQAAQLLGHPYVIEGRVQRGYQRGRTLGFPTANIPLKALFRPRYGVYSVRVQLDGKTYDAVANIGVKPTVGGEQPLLEVHLFDTAQDLYGRRIDVECVDFIRDEKKFDSLDALKDQIARDCIKAKEILHACA